jgi:predicted nucleic acid-binding protein
MPPVLVWDASALVKRYALEAGSATVRELFVQVPLSQMVATFPGYVETYAALVRKRNRGEITAATFRSAATFLQAELLSSLDFLLLTVENADLLDGVGYVEAHNLNATDAGILVTYLRYARARPPNSPTVVLVAADTRLLRAAEAEGLTTLNPETVAAADIPALLSAW